jgi:hypothetical protein
MGTYSLVTTAVLARFTEGYLTTSVYQSIPEDYGACSAEDGDASTRASQVSMHCCW